MKKVIVLLLSTLMLVGILVGCSAPATSESQVGTTSQSGAPAQAGTTSLLDEIIKKGKITIAVFSDVPPLGYMDEKNELKGIDVDVARELAKALGVEVEFVPTTNANRIPYLQTKKVDIVRCIVHHELGKTQSCRIQQSLFQRGGYTGSQQCKSDISKYKEHYRYEKHENSCF